MSPSFILKFFSLPSKENTHADTHTDTHTLWTQSPSQFTPNDVVPVNGDVAVAVLASVLVMHPQCVDDLVADVAHFAIV